MANLFLDVKDLLEQNDGLNYINYETLSEEHKEFLRSDLWDLEFVQTPAAVYFPGNTLLKARTTGCTPTFGASLTELTATIRQFKIRQSVISGDTSGTISVEYVDREDQAIRAFIDDWRDKIWNRKNRYSFRKEDTIATVKLTQFNTSRKPIAEFMMYGLQLSDGADDVLNKGFTSEDPSNNGEYSVTYAFEHYEVSWCNI